MSALNSQSNYCHVQVQELEFLNLPVIPILVLGLKDLINELSTTS